MRVRLHRLALGLAVAFTAAGCNTPRRVPAFDSGPQDAAPSTDASRADAPGLDAGTIDAALPIDGGTVEMMDAGVDAGSDAGIDGGIDSGTDAGTDAGRDSGSRDTGVDAFVRTDAGGRDAALGDAGMALPGTHLVLNEVEYDEMGTDTAEYLEIYNPTGATVDLSRFAVVFLSAVGGTEYDRYALSGSLGSGQYLVLASTATLATFTADREIAMTGASNLIQNGAPDGIALIDTTAMTLVDALSYEGSIIDITIVGVAGTVSLVEGVATTANETDSAVAGTLCRRPNGSDTDDAASDWFLCPSTSPGAANP